jgi:hypothetical protein
MYIKGKYFIIDFYNFKKYYKNIKPLKLICLKTKYKFKKLVLFQ